VERHGQVESTFCDGSDGEGRVVGVGDGFDDGESEPVPVGVLRSLDPESLEWSKQALNVIGFDDRAAVLDR
jgi:hypothetical protein